MSNDPTVPAKKRSWPKILGGLAGGLLLLLIIAYFIVTSSGFFKGVILPRASKALNATITVDSASISPFSQIVLNNLKIQTTGTEPLVTAPEVKLRYHLFAILGGNLRVDEVTLTSPTVNVIQNPDGSSNLDPLLKSQTPKTTQPTSTAKSSKPPQLDVKKVSLSNATVRQTRIRADGQRDVTELANVNLSLTDLKNGQTGKLTFGADASLNQPANAATPASSLQAKISGAFDFSLSADLKPVSVKGSTQLAVSQAGGGMAELSGLGADLDCEVTPTDIKTVALQFQKSSKSLGGLHVSGPFDVEKTEGTITVELLAIDRQVLNLAGAASGVDFGTTTINSTNQIELSHAGAVIVANGRVTAARLQVTRAGQTTPTLDASVDYNVTVDRPAQSARLQALTINATQNGAPLAHAGLSSPMTLAWGSASNAVGDSSLNLTVTNMDLVDWKPFLGDSVSGGVLNVDAALLSQGAGKQLSFTLASQVQNISVKSGDTQISRADVTVRVRGQASNLQQFKLEEYNVQLARSGQPLFTLSGTGSYDTGSAVADVQVRLQAALPALLQALPQTNIVCRSGTVDFTGHVEQKTGVQTVTGQFTLADLTGQLGANDFRSFGLATDFDVTKSASQIQIHKASGKLTEGANAGGSFDVSGSYDLQKSSGQLTAKLTDFNQNGLRTFLEPMLAGKQLMSVALNATVTASIDPQADSSVKADLSVAKLIVNDPAGQFPGKPLEAKFTLDAGLSKHVVDLRACQVTLTPTSRGKNEVRLTGRVDASQTNAISGSVKLAADSLDLTTYYDLFSAKPGTTTATAAPATPAAAPAGNPEEPKPVQLPFHNFSAEIAIGRLYLRDIDASDLQGTVKIDGGHVVLQPVKLTLNGAPVNATADLNLAVVGYQYDVAFSAAKLPIAPLVNSFSPDYKDRAKGDLFADAKIKGAGITGTSLQKSLTGSVNLVLTNADIQISGPKLKAVITPIALVLGLTELNATPLTGMNAGVIMGGGNIIATNVYVLSSAYRADLAGQIPIAPVLNNSPINDWPINISLSQNLANKAHLLASDTPTNAAYSKLPTFAKLSGTLGDPKTKTDKLVIGAMVARSALGFTHVGGGTGSLLQGAAGLLGGQSAPATQSSTTAAPATNASPALNLFNLLKKK